MTALPMRDTPSGNPGGVHACMHGDQGGNCMVAPSGSQGCTAWRRIRRELSFLSHPSPCLPMKVPSKLWTLPPMRALGGLDSGSKCNVADRHNNEP